MWRDPSASPTLVATSLGAAWFVVFLSAQVLLFRLRRATKRFATILQVLVAAMAGCVLSLAAGGLLSPLATVIGIVVMACFWVLYMPFYYVIANSTSVRTLIALDGAGGAMEIEELQSRFASPEILLDRLDTMVAYGNLVRQGSAFDLTPKGRMTACFFIGLKRLWRLGAGG